jgi:hypothetical protein
VSVTESRPPGRSWTKLWRVLLFALGAIALIGMVRHLGAKPILAAISGTAVWLPLICILDFLWVFIEGGAVLAIYGSARSAITVRSWIYVSLIHYTTFMLMPMGRASAEVARAALVRKQISRDCAAVGAALMQSLTMVSNGLTSLVAAAFVAHAAHSQGLLLALLGNAALMLVLGVSAYLVLRHIRIGGLLGRRFARLAEAGPGFDAQFRESKGRHGWALSFCFAGRCLQATQYGVIVFAVTGQFSVAYAWIAEGIQMAARSAGDFIPNQVGVTEGAFVLFRRALGLSELPALAMTLALVARLSNISVATLCMLPAQLWPTSETPRDEHPVGP